MTKYVVTLRQITWYDRLTAMPAKILKWAILIQLGLLLAAGVLGAVAHVVKLAIAAATGTH